MPRTLSTYVEDMGVVEKPNVSAGDVIFFMDGSQSHGARACPSPNQWKAILIKYTSRSTTRHPPYRHATPRQTGPHRRTAPDLASL